MMGKIKFPQLSFLLHLNYNLFHLQILMNFISILFNEDYSKHP